MMVKSNKTKIRNVLLYTKHLDVEQVVNDIFEGEWGGYRYLPIEAKQLFFLRIKLAETGQLNKRVDKLLKDKFSEFLLGTQNFSSTWSRKNPDKDKILESWLREYELQARWKTFISEFTRYKDFDGAYNYAFEQYQPNIKHFPSELKEKQYALDLFLEQQEKVVGISSDEKNLLLNSLNNPTPIMKAGFIYYQGKQVQLTSLQESLLSMLWDEEPQPVSEIVREVLGSHACDEKNKKKLSNRISELNKRLKALFGEHPKGKNWISLVQYSFHIKARLCLIKNFAGKTGFQHSRLLLQL